MLSINLFIYVSIGVVSFLLGLYAAYLIVAYSYREQEKAMDAAEYDEFLPTAFINEK